ncbi:uncharacterized protein BO80DRAFT_429715 [Aspergillus ibericus CBS 121593]|uniref:Uncharacterized protein n=1 Tax=Aspergillus ibericus CBS 121593 TaxID=1448316 RepID=A0A395GJH1_9EURO|nr:hypothetical protein BO80DRAFT_429715 [Aspergillus ibericus CBS 121593]RAK95609.1 hypothetical protein BO80DRAFT_429715 [Aspergillus ibericus CBS 121593]
MVDPFIPHFRSIGQNIHLHEPTSTPSDTHPALIILCTWFGGATPRRIAKYTTAYREHYPGAAIVLLNTCFRDYLARSFQTIDPNLTPARELITRVLHANRDASVLLHIFSNGGCNTVTQLARSMTTATGVDFRSAIKLMVFDCCPGDASFQRFYGAAAVALPATQPGRAIGTIILYPTLRVAHAVQSVGLMRSIDDYQADLNDPSLFGTEARRLYLYSLTDGMIPWEDVVGHMDEAREKGYSVLGVSFEDSRHCGLVMGNEMRYWNAIQRAWDGREVDVSGRSKL